MTALSAFSQQPSVKKVVVDGDSGAFVNRTAMDAVNRIYYKEQKYKDLSDSLKADLKQCDSSRHTKDLRIENLNGQIVLKDTMNNMLKRDKTQLMGKLDKAEKKIERVKTTRNIFGGISIAGILVIVLQAIIPH